MILRLDRVTGERLDAVAVPEGVGPMSAAPDALFFVKRDIDTLAQLAPSAGVPRDLSQLSGPLRSMRYTHGELFLIFEEGDEIARASPNGRIQVVASAGHRPTQAVLVGKHLAVTSRNDHSVLTLNPDDLLEASDPVRAGLNPVSMAVDGKSLWVASLDGTLTQIDYR
jgi:hypothetical protein